MITQKPLRTLLKVGSAALAIAAAGVTPAVAGPIQTSDAALAPFTLTYGDFNVVSLQFANTALNTSNYFVASSPGQIRDYIVVGTGAGGNFYNDGTRTGVMDQPYGTPNGTGGSPYFRTGNATSGPDPNGAGQFTGDTANSWDIKLADLKTYLGGENAVFYFNLNETGTDDKLLGTDMLIWAKVTLLTAANPNGPTQTFYLAGNPFDPLGADYGKQQSILLGGPDETASYPDLPGTGANSYPGQERWTYIHGNICVDGSTFLHYAACDGRAGETGGAQTVKQNLGANQAAFAAYNSTLNDLINNPGLYDTMQIDWRMADINNGYEQLFIVAGGRNPPPPGGVPEPMTLMMFGAGIAGIAAVRRRKTQA